MYAGYGVHHRNGKLYMLQTRNGKRTAQAAPGGEGRSGRRRRRTKEQAVMLLRCALVLTSAAPDVRSGSAQGSHADHHRPAGISWCSLRRVTSPLMMRYAHKTGIKAVLVRQEISGGYRRHGRSEYRDSPARRHDPHVRRSTRCKLLGSSKRHQGFRRG